MKTLDEMINKAFGEEPRQKIPLETFYNLDWREIHGTPNFHANAKTALFLAFPVEGDERLFAIFRDGCPLYQCDQPKTLTRNMLHMAGSYDAVEDNGGPYWKGHRPRFDDDL